MHFYFFFIKVAYGLKKSNMTTKCKIEHTALARLLPPVLTPQQHLPSGVPSARADSTHGMLLASDLLWKAKPSLPYTHPRLLSIFSTLLCPLLPRSVANSIFSRAELPLLHIRTAFSLGLLFVFLELVIVGLLGFSMAVTDWLL